MRYLQQLACALALGSAVVRALPQSAESTSSHALSLSTKSPAQDETLIAPDNAFDKRVTQQTLKIIDNQNTLYVPMGYIATMDKKGTWTRYACNEGSKCTVEHGTQQKPDSWQLSTDGLAFCLDINIYSNGGAIKAHIPASLCPILPGAAKSPDQPEPSDTDRQVLNNFKTALKELNGFRENLAKAGTVTTQVQMGPYTNPKDVGAILNQLFDETSYGGYHPISTHEAHTERSSRLDLAFSPPRFYVNNKEVHYTSGVTNIPPP